MSRSIARKKTAGLATRTPGDSVNAPAGIAARFAAYHSQSAGTWSASITLVNFLTKLCRFLFSWVAGVLFASLFCEPISWFTEFSGTGPATYVPVSIEAAGLCDVLALVEGATLAVLVSVEAP